MFGWFKKRASPSKGPDFSSVDSREKAAARCRRGELEELFLVPPEFGGADDDVNIVYVPVGVAGIKARIDTGTVLPMAREGKLTRYEASPEYEGASVVPISIKIVASDPERFTSTINIWGKALGRGRGA